MEGIANNIIASNTYDGGNVQLVCGVDGWKTCNAGIEGLHEIVSTFLSQF